MPLGNANPRGAWAVGTAYAPNDTVTYEGRSFVCMASSTGNDPLGDEGSVFWAEFESGGPGSDMPGGELMQSVVHRAVQLNEATYTAAAGDVIFAAVTTAITLPPASDAGVVEVISVGASITATVAPATGLVNGAASVTVTTQYTKKTFRSDGFAWFAA